MTLRFVFVCFLACISLAAHAYPAEIKYIPFEEAMRDPRVVQVLKPGIRIQWAGQQFDGEIKEHSRSDRYWRRFKRPSFIPVMDRCMEIFAEAISDMLKDAEEREYDLVYAMRGVLDDKPHENGNVLVCDHGFRFTDVTLDVSFGLTRAGADKLDKQRNDPEYLARLRNRQLNADTLLLPLGPIFESSDAQKTLGGIKAHWGLHDVPHFVERLGADAYSDSASIKKFGKEGACQQAALNALLAMTKDARSGGYNGIVMIRSHYKDQWAPEDNQLECDVSGSSAEITLRATLVRLD